MNASASSSTVALTKAQRLQLLGGLWPLAAFGVIVAAYLVGTLLGVFPSPSALFSLLIAVVLLFTVYQALQAIRDLRSGVVLVVEDVLMRSWRTTPPSNELYGKFERLGTLRVDTGERLTLSPNARYRVSYSPASKIAWEVVTIDPHRRKE
ncbi:MAG: hypothetical protein RLZZ387_3798 [Chloroflexota bacterium]|jgi:hypothetical protein